MAYKSLFDGIIFIEGPEDGAKIIAPLKYEREAFYNNQLKNLDNVKSQLAQKAKQLNANAIIHFEYGQKNTTWFRSLLLSLDDNVNWYGSGTAVLLSQERYSDIVESLKNK